MPSFEFLGPYRIGKPLGRGGMGTVYAAVHEKTGERVAVKLIAQHVSDEMKFRRRFDQEIKTLQRLRHEGIVRPIGVGEQEGQLFYSMELVEGESLQARIKREKRIDWRQALDIAIQICAALKHAHDIGVIHRDLKPANLMLTSDNKVKLVDFGIAKIFGDGEQTLPGSVLGTADYMAPEQALSTGITARTDLYALGNVMYAMLTGRPPFTGKKVTEVIESLKRDRPVPLDLVNPDLPDALVELVHELLEKDANDRPPTALAVMNRLKAMRAGLQREQTVFSAATPTQLETPQPDSHDTNPSGSRDSSAATDLTGPGDDIQRRRTVVSKGGSARKQKPGQQAITVVSDAASNKTVRPDGSVAQRDRTQTKTHFQTVSDTPSVSGVFQDDAQESVASWMGWLTIAAMVAVLLTGAGLFIYAMRPPDADQLYADVVGAGDMSAANTFMRRFPDDERFDEVRNRFMENRLRGIRKRLDTQRRLGISPLSPAEEGFLTAIDGREQEPVQALRKVKQWRTLYDNDDNQADPNISELIEMARHEERQLAIRAPEIIIDPRAQTLIEEIDRIVAQDDPEDVYRKLNAFAEIHPQEWARPAVEVAREQLDRLLESSGAEGATGARPLESPTP